MNAPKRAGHRARRRHGRALAAYLAVCLSAPTVASCFLPRMMEPPLPDPEPGEVAEGATAEGEPGVSPPAAAMIDAIEAAVADSVAAAAREPAAPSRDEVAAARRDSMLAAARRVARAVSARRDSIADAEARRDSVAAVAAAEADSTDAGDDADPPDSTMDAATPDPAAAPDPDAELAQLRESGPTYTAYDEGPRLVWDTDAEALLATTLLPVIRAEDLDAGTSANLWLLVRSDGRVDARTVQRSSGSAAFDAAAERAAAALIFAPALREGRAVPLWIVREISLLMR